MCKGKFFCFRRATFPSITLPVSFGCREGEKSVRFSSPLEFQQPQSCSPKKTTKEAIKGIMGAVKEKLLFGEGLRYWGDTTLISTVDNGWEFFPHNLLP